MPGMFYVLKCTYYLGKYNCKFSTDSCEDFLLSLTVCILICIFIALQKPKNTIVAVKSKLMPAYSSVLKLQTIVFTSTSYTTSILPNF